MVDPHAKPIPFRKPKRKQGETLVRPTARIIPAGSVVVQGEVAIPIMPFARGSRRAA
jgi:hypothetical protein